MAVERGVVAGCILLAVTALIYLRHAPPAMHSPGALVSAGIAAADRRLATGEAGPDAVVVADARERSPSALIALITGRGAACDAIRGIAPIRAGDGIFEVECRVGARAIRYRVDTHGATVGPLA